MVNLLLFILCAVLFTGCSSKTEVRDRAFVQAAAVSENNHDTISVAIRIFDDDKTYQGIGTDFFEAVKNAELQQDKYFFTGHMELMISSAGNNKKILEDIIQSNTIPPSCIFVCSDSALDFIQQADCDKLTGILKIRAENGMAVKKSIWSVLEELTDKGTSKTDCVTESGKLAEAELSA